MKIKIDEDLILLDLPADSKEEVLGEMADVLNHQGFVKESYKAAVIAREKIFATGLPTASCGVAIPHTDIVHVIEPAICFARLKKAVDFVVMGEESETVETVIVFMLAMNEPDAQLDLLQKLMGMFQNAETMQYLSTATDKKEVQSFILEKLN